MPFKGLTSRQIDPPGRAEHNQLCQFLSYEGVKFGVAVRLADPRYTSKTGHCCKVIGNWQGKRFECLDLSCGWIGDADVNGAKNIATLGMLVNHSRGSEVMSCSLQEVVLRTLEKVRKSRHIHFDARML